MPANLKGQTLVIILLGTSVALSVALAVSVRTISTLKQTTTGAQASESLAAAEAGAEVALSNLKNGANCVNGTEANCFASGVALPNGTVYSFVTSRAGGGTDSYLVDLAKDQTQEVKFTCGGVAGCTDYPNGSSLNVYWYNPNLDGTTEPSNALELIYVYENGDGTIGLSKYAYNGTSISPTNGFTSNPSSPATIYVAGKPVTFNHQITLTLSNKPRILRVKSFYSNISAAVSPQGGNTLPPQGFVVNSTGQTADGSVKKAVRVTKSLPALPSIFDFAIYSGSSTQPLSK